MHSLKNFSSKLILPVLCAVICFFISGCGKEYSPEVLDYIQKVEKSRVEKDDYMKNNPSSPFNFKGKVEFHSLNYYEIDPDFVFKSKLTEFVIKDTVTVLGTKGEERKVVKFGYVTMNFKNIEYLINVYEGKSKSGETYYSIWFTDKTTGEDTYGVGRYLDFELSEEKDFIYTIDFNLAYNPYCAYSSEYSCAVPTKDDFMDLSIEAGEKNFH